MNVRVDLASRSALGICACGARYLAGTHADALKLLAAHEERAHPGDDHARNALHQYRKRHATPTAPPGLTRQDSTLH